MRISELDEVERKVLLSTNKTDSLKLFNGGFETAMVDGLSGKSTREIIRDKVRSMSIPSVTSLEEGDKQ